MTQNGRMLCIPLDHGVSMGPVKGLDNIFQTISRIEKGGATAFLAHKGILRALPKPASIGSIMHVSASTPFGPDSTWKVRVGSVAEAIRLGADAVSVHVNIGSTEEPTMLQKLGKVADECDEWNMPFIAMMYPRGQGIKDPESTETLAHVARIGAELGADIVKVPYSGDVESFRRVVQSCPVPVVMAGGPKLENDFQVLKMASEAVQSGAIGITIGRNVFQHDNPDGMVRALRKIVIENSVLGIVCEELGIRAQ